MTVNLHISVNVTDAPTLKYQWVNRSCCKITYYKNWLYTKHRWSVWWDGSTLMFPIPLHTIHSPRRHRLSNTGCANGHLSCLLPAKLCWRASAAAFPPNKIRTGETGMVTVGGEEPPSSFLRLASIPRPSTLAT